MATEHFSTTSPRGEYSRQSMRERVPESLNRGYQSVEECITHYPASSVLVSFVGGLGLGMALGYAMAEPERRRSASRQWMQQLGQQVLEAVKENLPESIAERPSRWRT